MRMQFQFLADHAEIHDNKLTMIGGGWGSYWCPSVPAAISAALCGMIELESDERDRTQRLDISVVDDFGNNLGFSASTTVAAPIGDGPALSPIVVPVNLVVAGPVVAIFKIEHEGEVIGSCELPISAPETNA